MKTLFTTLEIRRALRFALSVGLHRIARIGMRLPSRGTER